MSAHVNGDLPRRRQSKMRDIVKEVIKEIDPPPSLPLLDERQHAEAWLTSQQKRAKAVGPFGDVFTITAPTAAAMLARNPNN